jgi:hypothetical protein
MSMFSYAVGHDRGHPPPKDEYVYSVSADDAVSAAVMAAEESDRREVSYPSEQDIWIQDENGREHCYTVGMCLYPFYTAYPNQRGEGKV